MFAVLSPVRKLFGRFTILISILWLAACQPVDLSNTGGGKSINPSAPVPVALLIPLSAQSPQEQNLARDLENAARLAASDLDSVKIDLRVYDTGGQAGLAQSAALSAVADGAKIIIGPLHAESANAVAVAVANRNVNVLAFSNNATIAGGNLFVLGQTFQNTADRLASFASRQGKKRFVAVHSNNLSGQLGKQAIEQAVAISGATMAGSVGYDFSQQGVVAAIPAIKAAVTNNNADAIFLTSNTAGALPLFSQMLPEAGISPATTQFIGLSRWDTPPQTLALPGVQGGWFALPDPQRSAQYITRFQAAYGNSPHAISGLAYDAIAAIGALAKSGSRTALTRGSLTQPAGFQGVNGVFRLLADGTNERGLAVATIRDQKLVVIAPAPQGFGGAGF
ncbi:Penicillin-binding protein activator LpoA [Roseovarius litorisediminis]|uniref:Penicillin-binding protein activator LpoA n=1 Tax=Roseovarius litorisediminis TaxID=1312363 RepID=A0A1Y5RR19_9RHOB|nr:penicillin-binding protein activator [Roseovarius litorisediminis]SLN22951.1 Penicillin-binding protein activator LpoA [Roseovarius litorisediminis]